MYLMFKVDKEHLPSNPLININGELVALSVRVFESFHHFVQFNVHAKSLKKNQAIVSTQYLRAYFLVDISICPEQGAIHQYFLV